MGKTRLQRSLIVLILVIAAWATTKGQVTELQQPSEIKVGKAVKSFNKIAELSYTIKGSDTIYLLSFSDYKYLHIEKWSAIAFKATKAEIDTLHRIVKDLMASDVGTEKALQLGEYKCNAKLTKSLGVKQLYFYFLDKFNLDNGIMILEKKNIDSLFGK